MRKRRNKTTGLPKQKHDSELTATQRTALAKGIPPGLYSETQVHQFLEETHRNRVIRFMEIANNTIIPLGLHILNLEKLLDGIDKVALIFEGDELRTRLPRKLVGELASAYTLVESYVGEPNAGLSETYAKCLARREAIEALHNRTDEGALLRKLAISDDLLDFSQQIASWREALSKAGRPKGITPETRRIGEIIEQFLATAKSKNEAYRLAYEHFIQLKSPRGIDAAVKEQIDKWDGDATDNMKKIYQSYRDEQGKKLIFPDS